MSSMGELTFFLGLQVKHKDDGIFISQDKYVADILKKFDFSLVKTTSTLIETNKAFPKDEEVEDVDVYLYRSMIGSLMDSPFDLEAFFNSDYAGASLDRKSTTGGCQFLGKRLISWQCKKQTIVANSTTEVEYVVAANCCRQVLWIQNQMLDYGFNFINTKIYIDNKSTICIVKNPVFHSKTKHIEIRHHFIRDSYEKKLIQVIKIHTDQNVADLLTKAFDVSRFNFLVSSIGLLNLRRCDLVLLGKRRITPLFASMLVPQVFEGKGSGQPSEPQPPSSTAPPSQVTTVATHHQKTHKPRRAKRGQETEIPQSSGPPNKSRKVVTSIRPDPRQHLMNHLLRDLVQSHDPPLSEGNTSGSGEDSMEHQVDLTDFVPPTPYDSPLSGGHTPGSDEGRPNFNELINLCTQLSNRVLALENSKTAQDLVIQKLKKRVKRLEKALRARTPGMKLFKIGTSRRKGLDKENVSKQGRKSDKTKPMFNDSDFDVLDDAMENVEGDSTAEQITTTRDTLNTDSINVSTAGPSHVSTAGPLNVSVPGPSTSTAGDIFEDDMTTIANTLVAIRSARPRTISVMICNVEEELRRAKPVPTVQSQDKEEQAQFEKEQRIAREKAAEQEAKDAALIEQMEDVQARMDADELLAERLQQEEREQFTIDEQARMLVDLIAERKKFFATQRVEQIRNKLPTRAQLRNKMVTYLKHMGNYTHTQLKSKSFEEIQKLYEKEQKWINDFVSLDSEMVKDSGKEDGTFYFFLGFLTSARTWFELRFKVEKSCEDEMKVEVVMVQNSKMVTSSLLSVQFVVVAYKEVMEVLVRCWSDGDVVVGHGNEGGGESWRSLRCLFSLYMAVFGQPTSVPVIWFPFTNRNSDQPQTSEHG
ncbi:hypothetical protein Tco_0694276 [Tanacetum coccineum]